MRRFVAATFALGLLLGTACSSPADTVSSNLSKAADQFEVERRIVFYNGITDTYMMTILGKCSLGNNDPPYKLTVTCQTGERAFKKHFLHLSDNVTYFVEQMEDVDASDYRYRVIFRPTTIIPDFELDN